MIMNKNHSSCAFAALAAVLGFGAPILGVRAQSAAPPHVAPTIEMTTHVLPPMNSGEKTGPIIAATANGIAYNGGPVLLNSVHVYLIWYGAWTGDTSTTIIPDLLANIGGSAYYNINTTYYDSANNYVSNAVTIAGSTTDNYSQGTNLTDAAVQAITSGAITSGRLPSDSNGVYFVVTSSDVHETSGFCTSYCGWHTHATVAGIDIKYAFVGDASQQCPTSCTAQPLSSPNGNVGADGMASVIAHELEESVTDPDLNAWHNAGNSENADLCAWKFGTEYTVANGSKANVAMGTRNYLIQENWVNANGGSCAMALSNTLPAPASISVNVTQDCPLTLVGWAPVAGATSYAVYSEQANLPPWFGTGGLKYTGAAVQKDFRNPAGVNYLWKVEACNANGCSALSAATGSGASPRVCP